MQVNVIRSVMVKIGVIVYVISLLGASNNFHYIQTKSGHRTFDGLGWCTGGLGRSDSP